ncbi:sulfite exporter TauE/SafE family protein [Roseibacillus ishigakijimensis]|uniref:Probable membrane transporter protein n=1 Tax=Roseibacillus ishigakijimensis TaxID=454146 RepID=A0A934VLL7_9BACT|nr:sulfite exporter TauE/SafE family protein [Roseibacillus ishigakijimensis]MBK1833236.1 sulfite exporter TauE/SafE family protein [Roseibacillus ishigakijimensis]
MKLFLTALLIGAAAGLAGALLGVGGGIIMVPAFGFLLGMEQKAAVATSLAVVVVTAVIGTSNHVINRTDLIDWRLVGLTAVGAAVAAWFGSDWMRTLSNPQLTRIFGVLMIVIGIKMLWK